MADKDKPIFHDCCGVLACFNPESLASEKRETQREAQRVREAIKEEEKREQLIAEWEKKKEACIEEGQRLGILNSRDIPLLQPIEAQRNVSKDVAEDLGGDLSRKNDCKNGWYSEEICNLACHFAAIGVTFQKIPLCIEEVIKFSILLQNF